MATRTYDDYYSLEELRCLVEYIEAYYSDNKRTIVPQVIEDAVYYLVPNLIDTRAYDKDPEISSCFKELGYGDVLLGKRYKDIKYNLQYKKDYISGEKKYNGPELFV